MVYVGALRGAHRRTPLLLLAICSVLLGASVEKDRDWSGGRDMVTRAQLLQEAEGERGGQLPRHQGGREPQAPWARMYPGLEPQGCQMKDRTAATFGFETNN